MEYSASFLQLWIPSVASFVNSETSKGLLGTTLTSNTGVGMDTRLRGQRTAIKEYLINTESLGLGGP